LAGEEKQLVRESVAVVGREATTGQEEKRLMREDVTVGGGGCDDSLWWMKYLFS
jgi:hypothetical protein